MCLLGVSINNHIYGSKVPQNSHFGGLNRHFKPNMRKIQIAISSDLCQIDMKFDRQLWPATETSWVVSFGGKTILVFPYQTGWRYCDGLTGTTAILKIVISPYPAPFSDYGHVTAPYKLLYYYYYYYYYISAKNHLILMTFCT